MVGYTSAVAYREHVLEGKACTQRARILSLLMWSDACLSRAGIREYFIGGSGSDTWDFGPEIPLASVCGRVNALVKAGLVKVKYEATDPVTGHRVEYVEAVRPTPRQKCFDGFLR